MGMLYLKDYEEDFEELNESTNEDEDEKEPLHPQSGEAKEELSAQRRKEIEAIRRAMDEENERIGTTKSRQSTSKEEEERPKWSRGIFLPTINVLSVLLSLCITERHIPVKSRVFCAGLSWI